MLTEVSKTRLSRPVNRDPREEIEALGREVFGDDFEEFLVTPRRSLGSETPAVLLLREDYQDVLALLRQMVIGYFD